MKSAEITGGSGFPSRSCRGRQIKPWSSCSCPFLNGFDLLIIPQGTGNLHVLLVQKQGGRSMAARSNVHFIVDGFGWIC